MSVVPGVGVPGEVLQVDFKIPCSPLVLDFFFGVPLEVDV